VPESVAPNIRNRSYTIAVEVTLDSEEAGGVLFAHGSRFGGHALHQGPQAQVRLQLGRHVRAGRRVDRARPDGSRRAVGLVRARGRRLPAEGTLALHIREQPAGDGRIKTQPGKFSIAGEGLNVGREGAEPVTDDYPGEAPWAFVDGTIHKCVIDVSGEPFVDLANEAAMAFARD
jgi:hypothetical protein